jgi:hypothetical protein
VYSAHAELHGRDAYVALAYARTVRAVGHAFEIRSETLIVTP